MSELNVINNIINDVTSEVSEDICLILNDENSSKKILLFKTNKPVTTIELLEHFHEHREELLTSNDWSLELVRDTVLSEVGIMDLEVENLLGWVEFYQLWFELTNDYFELLA